MHQKAWFDSDDEEYHAQLFVIPETSSAEIVFFDPDGSSDANKKSKKSSSKKSKKLFDHLFEPITLDCLDTTDCDVPFFDVELCKFFIPQRYISAVAVVVNITRFMM